MNNWRCQNWIPLADGTRAQCINAAEFLHTCKHLVCCGVCFTAEGTSLLTSEQFQAHVLRHLEIKKGKAA